MSRQRLRAIQLVLLFVCSVTLAQTNAKPTPRWQVDLRTLDVPHQKSLFGKGAAEVGCSTSISFSGDKVFFAFPAGSKAHPGFDVKARLLHLQTGELLKKREWRSSWPSADTASTPNGDFVIHLDQRTVFAAGPSNVIVMSPDLETIREIRLPADRLSRSGGWVFAASPTGRSLLVSSSTIRSEDGKEACFRALLETETLKSTAEWRDEECHYLTTISDGYQLTKAAKEPWPLLVRRTDEWIPLSATHVSKAVALGLDSVLATSDDGTASTVQVLNLNGTVTFSARVAMAGYKVRLESPTPSADGHRFAVVVQGHDQNDRGNHMDMWREFVYVYEPPKSEPVFVLPGKFLQPMINPLAALSRDGSVLVIIDEGKMQAYDVAR